MSEPSDRSAVDERWWIYIVRCRFGTLYTGVTNNLDKRLQQHIDGKGAKYLRGRAPLQVKFRQQVENKSVALTLERRIKRLSRADKLRLIRTGSIDV